MWCVIKKKKNKNKNYLTISLVFKHIHKCTKKMLNNIRAMNKRNSSSYQQVEFNGILS